MLVETTSESAFVPFRNEADLDLLINAAVAFLVLGALLSGADIGSLS